MFNFVWKRIPFHFLFHYREERYNKEETWWIISKGLGVQDLRALQIWTQEDMASNQIIWWCHHLEWVLVRQGIYCAYCLLLRLLCTQMSKCATVFGFSVTVSRAFNMHLWQGVCVCVCVLYGTVWRFVKLSLCTQQSYRLHGISNDKREHWKLWKVLESRIGVRKNDFAWQRRIGLELIWFGELAINYHLK